MKILLGVLLLVGGLAGLFMSVCGAVFTVGALLDWGEPESFSSVVLVISLPSLMVGLALAYAVFRGYPRWFGNGQPPTS